MNKNVFALLCLILSTSVFSQGLSSADLSFNKLDKEDAFIVSPAVRFDYNNHGWSIGPALLFSFGDQIEERESVKLTGITIGYENFLHGKSAKWNMFHSFDFIAQRIKDVQDSQIFDTNSGVFVPNNIEQVDNNIFISASAGVLWNLNDKLSLTQTIGIGANAIFRNTTSDFDDFSDTFINQQWSLKTGIRYNLN